METFREYRRMLDSPRICNNNLPNECSVARISIHNACVDRVIRVIRVTVTVMPYIRLCMRKRTNRIVANSMCEYGLPSSQF